jgi:hypothetical protein
MIQWRSLWLHPSETASSRTLFSTLLATPNSSLLHVRQQFVEVSQAIVFAIQGA